MALTDDAHARIRDYFSGKEKLLAIDATCGNGHDTQFLAGLGFSRVVGFDIQDGAIKTSAHKIEQAGYDNVEFIHASHELMAQYINTSAECVMFNFGYLPCGDKSLSTEAEKSVLAITAATKLLSNNGLISLMCYPGHPAGAIETRAIQKYLATLGQGWIVETHLAVSPKPTAPILYLIKRHDINCVTS